MFGPAAKAGPVAKLEPVGMDTLFASELSRHAAPLYILIVGTNCKEGVKEAIPKCHICMQIMTIKNKTNNKNNVSERLRQQCRFPSH